ncbi:hypothetical protein [Acidovorax sp. Leaf160]|uniref:hypothetical protein n=1 Tax=Acidovorax sp. Leaf160 TaxID=1736280 RepID=UPI0006FEAF0B|nr:hypothetical protein [Acidovorax sp. Leaf160]KQR41555.1 hypothetical protein ASF94_12710 [Acidovorax sp. Leaf160]
MLSTWIRLTCCGLLALPASLSLAQPASTSSPAGESVMWITPSIGGMALCDKAMDDPKITDLAVADQECRKRKADGAVAAVTRLLDTLEPGGPQGRVQVGYTATLQLLDLYRKTPKGWEIDQERLNSIFRTIEKIKRPVVLYLSSSHFDSQGPITEELIKDPRNLLQLKNGKPLELGYFGYRIVPYTLLADPTIPVNRYRFEAVRHVAKRIKAMPEAVRKRVIAITLAGELHHLFPDFEHGMGAYADIQVTDYSPGSVAGFRSWLQKKYGTVSAMQEKTGLAYASFDVIQPPAKDIRKETLSTFGDHYDAFADGTLPFTGWLWDPLKKVTRLDLYVDGKLLAEVPYGMNRLDVYRAEASITSPNTGFRYDLDYSQMRVGKHRVQVVAMSGGSRYLVGERDFVIVPRDQSSVPNTTPVSVNGLKGVDKVEGVRSWLDLPKSLQDVYFNPLARDWNAYREVQVRDFTQAFHDVALKAGLPRDKLYSHQIVPQVNSTWNPQLFAADLSLAADVPWKQGLNMYGGATDSAWMRKFLADRKISDYGVPEFNPQQWKTPGVHLAALQSHLKGGARFVSPYYFSIIPDKFKAGVEHSVNRMEIGPTNPKDGSDALYQAIIEFARQ